MFKFICFICKKDFKSAKLLIKHLLAFHACNKDTVYVCPVRNCEQNFQSVHSYKKHLLKHQNNGENEACSEKFKTENKIDKKQIELSEHMRITDDDSFYFIENIDEVEPSSNNITSDTLLEKIKEFC